MLTTVGPYAMEEIESTWIYQIVNGNDFDQGVAVCMKMVGLFGKRQRKQHDYS